ncbi:hypothetical protein DL89DRAFT_6172 [Linderina pennispora]|uniref:Uncharacterized protein n=1 Tax=Linderina pennispora TaxID=61395 RepID=A0A1Y1WK95_9FUNG|nr:uncharacterized protein DL89DRAFT_6172 [Linderina pennispora]ORX73902.1 hypothetical protein DL89DRAFT_6172 [Linderina pennispora]
MPAQQPSSAPVPTEGQVPETVDEMHQDAESPQFAMPVLGESPVEESHMAGPYTVSRLHRRLSMQMMRRERERQERQIERARRNLVEAAGFGRTRAPRSALKNALQKPEPERAHADEIARTPAEFPELKDQKAKPKEALKETQKEPQKEPPSRIPAYRAPPAARAANVRPLSSFGRPPPANNSSIPRAPRARPTSPPGSTADSSKPNVFLRLARRLNRAKDVQPAPALGTMPRKMNLLLPAAAQYMQHPRRPAMPQVQVFRARPTDAPMRRHSHVEDDFVILDHDAADEQPARRRAATVARPPLNGRYGNVQPLRQPEPPARASSIIPSITRRLGLGFPFGQRPTDNRSTASMDIGRSERAPIPEAFEAVHVSSSSSFDFD